VAASFTTFARVTLGLALTRGQTALASVAFDGALPGELADSRERAAAISMYGDLQEVPEVARRVAVLRCGRASGKSTLAAARGLHRMLCASLDGVGRHSTPVVMCICPNKKLSKEMVRIARAMVDGTPELRSRVTASTADGFSLKRHDGRIVSFVAIPKSRGGAAARGVDILLAILDESEFLPTIDSVNAPVTDGDMIGALMPRLLREGSLLLTSTPWPVVSATSELFDRNWMAPSTALVAKAITPLMRDEDPLIMGTIALEQERDAANAAREYFCEQVSLGATFFDHGAIANAVTAERVPSDPGRTFAAVDLGFRVDPSTLCVVRWIAPNRLVLVHLEELKPRPGAPLQPSAVVSQFAETARELGASSLIADHHYIESTREHALALGISVAAGPGGATGKEKSYIALRDALREGQIMIPNASSPLVQRLVGQLRNVTSKAQPGGGLSITSPRRAGAHGDLLSALVLAFWQARNGAGSVPQWRDVPGVGSIDVNAPFWVPRNPDSY
jgi:hypothetical protein